MTGRGVGRDMSWLPCHTDCAVMASSSQPARCSPGWDNRPQRRSARLRHRIPISAVPRVHLLLLCGRLPERYGDLCRICWGAAPDWRGCRRGGGNEETADSICQRIPPAILRVPAHLSNVRQRGMKRSRRWRPPEGLAWTIYSTCIVELDLLESGQWRWCLMLKADQCRRHGRSAAPSALAEMTGSWPTLSTMLALGSFLRCNLTRNPLGSLTRPPNCRSLRVLPDRPFWRKSIGRNTYFCGRL